MRKSSLELDRPRIANRQQESKQQDLRVLIGLCFLSGFYYCLNAYYKFVSERGIRSVGDVGREDHVGFLQISNLKNQQQQLKSARH